MTKLSFEEIAKSIPNAQKAADGFILSDGNFTFHAFDSHPKELTEGLTHRETFYLAFCSRDEILRIRNQKTSSDFLLWLRAEAIVDSARTVRVFRKRAKNVKDWSLTKYYENQHQLHKYYINEVGKSHRKQIRALPAGMAFINEVNAMCINSDFGNIVVVSEALSYFLFFMNIAFLGGSLGIPTSDISTALAIAIRIMLGYESLDFDLDPRGDLPPKIHETIQEYTNYQIFFTFGHEYAHHTLGHLDEAKLANIKLRNIVYVTERDNSVRCFHHKHRKEYEADWFAIKNIKGNKDFRSALSGAAFMMFIYFDVLDHVYQYLALSHGISKTHPRPLDRLCELRRRLNKRIGSTSETITANIELANTFKKILTSEWLPFHIDELEIYGSYYLPSYKKEILRDRIDF
jgi:hypothetical protein